MSLLKILLKIMLSKSVLSSLTAKTGLESGQVSSLLTAALPTLLSSMTKNASSEEGATSLLNALQQHAGTKSAASMIDEADEEDGGKIIGHILGDDKDAVISSLSKEAGVDNTQVSQLLSTMAPTLLSGLSAATTGTAEKKDTDAGFDLGSLTEMFGIGDDDAADDEKSGIMGIIGKLFGGKDDKEDASVDGSELLSSLMSFMK